MYIPPYLLKDETFNIDLIEPIRRGHADILHESQHGVAIHEKNGDLYIFSVDSTELLEKLFEDLLRPGLVVVHNKAQAEFLKNKYGFSHEMKCYQAARFDKSPLEIPEQLDIRPLDMSAVELVHSVYKAVDDVSYIEERIAAGELFGAFINDELAGFAGFHEEGSIGLLEVLPKYRRIGIGRALEAYVVNVAISKNQVPFCQVKIDNDVSLRMQKSLGFAISDDVVTWLFK